MYALAKWIDTNDVAEGLLYTRGKFYDYMKSKIGRSDSTADAEATDHQYNTQRVISFKDFVKRSKPDDQIDLVSIVDGFKPCSDDPERLFSYGRLSKTYLQNRLTPENHSRNVFINKNASLLD